MPYQLNGVTETNNIQNSLEDGAFSSVQTSIPMICGASGCGFCALWKLQRAGVTHLKIVGRGGNSDDMARDIAFTKRAIEILETSSTEEEYISKMKAELFPQGCSENCYLCHGDVFV